MYTALIIEDEKPARSRIQKLLKSFTSEINKIYEATTYEEAVSLLSDSEPNIIFLDIQLKNKTGFDVLEAASIPQESVLIFTTAYDEHAVRAFDVYAFDYLLKPYKDERFNNSIKRALKKLTASNVNDWEGKIKDVINYIEAGKSQQEFESIPVKISNKTYFVKVEEIEYISASGYYAELYVDKQKHLIRESLTNLDEKLPNDKFVRIHRSTIINKAFLKELISIGYGDYEVKMTDGKSFRVSKTYKKDLDEMLGLT